MKNCPKCQSSVSDTAKFCVKCGFNIKKFEEENQQKEYFCAECGTKFSGGTFCPECGYNVAKDLGEKAELAMDDTLSIDFSAISQAASDQLFEKEGFIVENGVLMSYKGNKRSIVIHDVEEIYDGAFKDNQIVTFVEIKEGVKIIGKKAFADCGSLVKINIPASVEKIYDDAFEGVRLDTLILSKMDTRLIKQFLSGFSNQHFNEIEIDKYISEADGKITVDIKEIEISIDKQCKAKEKAKAEAEEEKKRKAKEELQKKVWGVGGNPTFGSYTVDHSKGKAPLEWTVLERNGNNALIITKNVVEFSAYDKGVNPFWSHSYVRTWLNNSFFKRAFTEEEKAKIVKTNIDGYQSNVFILSYDEVVKYFEKAEERRCKRVYYSDWWLRERKNAAYGYMDVVRKTGGFSVENVSESAVGVRPAMWIDLSFLNEQ